MGKTAGQKVKLLLLAEILRKYTDEQHPLSATEISEKMEAEGYFLDRKTIYAGISALEESGADIIKTRSPKAGYYMGDRGFEMPEIYLISDAVQSAGFLSRKKTRQLIEKLEAFLSVHQVDKLKRRVYIDNRNKCDNEEIFYNIDTLSNAVWERHKITFTYCRRVLDENGKIVTEEKELTVSPYALIWSDDRYYLVCNNAKYDNLMHVRIDRIRRVVDISEPARSFREVSDYKNFFDTADYAKKVFNMYGGVPEKITFRCDNGLIETMLDRFSDISVRDCRDGKFSFVTEATVSPGLVNWIIQFGGGIEVLSPKSLRTQVKTTAENILKLYGAEKD